MSVRRKLFLAMAAIILAMGIVSSLLTRLIVWGVTDAMLRVDRTAEMEALAETFASFYRQEGATWSGIERIDPGGAAGEGASYALYTPRMELLYASGPEVQLAAGLGLRKTVEVGGETIALLFYYDADIGARSKIKHGISSSVTVLTLAGAVVFTFLALLVAFFLSKRLTAPLQSLVVAIERLAGGQLGVQTDIQSKDEYGTVGEAFNTMSAQLQQAEMLRRNLVADVAHELRTPITIIRGKLELMQQAGHSIEPEQLLPLQDELIRLTRLVEDLNQLSLAEANKLPMEFRPVSMPALLSRTIERLQPQAVHKSVELKLVAASDVKALQADPNRLSQVFVNLIGNAIRYTPAGGSVTVTIGEKAGMLRVAVTDTGIGIDPEHVPFLFDRFYRTDQARTRHDGGLGLGLAIAKQFVLLHGGTIEVESAVGEGTTVLVLLPKGE